MNSEPLSTSPSVLSPQSSVLRSYRWLFWTLALIGLCLDQTSKYEVFRQLFPLARPDKYGNLVGETEIIPGAFNLHAAFTYERETETGLLASLRGYSSEYLPGVNHGALFGHGRTVFGWKGNTVFALVSVAAALAIICWCLRANTRRDRFLCLALGLILAGTLGNLYDRIVFGGVRDFLYWFYLVDWPVFNIADCCLVCGAGLLLVQAFFTEPHQVVAEKATSASEQEVAAAKEPHNEHNASPV
jgi:signal peptidase II